MADINVQIKQRNGVSWDNLYPVTKAPIIITNSDYRFVKDSDIENWNNKQNALGFTPENVSNKNKANGYAGLDVNGKISDSQIPKIAISETYVVDSQINMLALTAEIGDIAIRTDEVKSYILKNMPASILINWEELLTPSVGVNSVNGKTGVVNITKEDLGLTHGVNINVSETEPSNPINLDLWLSIV